MKSVKGNLITMSKEGKFNIMVHGCNCHCAMGAGIAAQIKREFPAAYKADCATKKGDKKKLGTYSQAKINETLTVINAYTQYDFGGGRVNANYRAIRECFAALKTEYGNKGLTFGIPLIGCGLAGGDWKIVKEIIEEEMKDEDLTLVVL